MSVVISLSLLHFLWQGALIGGAGWLGMRIARTPAMRYSIGVSALALMAAAPLSTAAWLRGQGPGPSLAVQGPGSHVPGTSSSQVPEPIGSGARFGSGFGSGVGSRGPTLDANAGQQVQEPKSTRDVGPAVLGPARERQKRADPLRGLAARCDVVVFASLGWMVARAPYDTSIDSHAAPRDSVER